MLNQIISILSQNPVASVSILLGLVIFLIAVSARAEIGGLVTYGVDHSSRLYAGFVGLIFIAFGLVVIVDPSLSSIISLFRETPIQKLHRAARAWDTATAFQAAQQLQSSSDKCDQMLGIEVQELVSKRGPSILNYVNRIQQNIELSNPDCRFPKLNHPDQV